MNKIRLALLLFSVFLGMVVYTADVGTGLRYWGWLEPLPLGDKVGHCGLMFTFCLLANLALRCRSTGPGQASLLIGTAVVAMIVAGEEFSQLWIPGRDFDLLDLAADALGIALRTCSPEGSASDSIQIRRAWCEAIVVSDSSVHTGTGRPPHCDGAMLAASMPVSLASIRQAVGLNASDIHSLTH